MRVALVQPRCAAAVDVEYVSLQFPLNLGYLAAALRADGHEVRLVDRNVQPPAALDRLLREFAPEVVGVTSMTAAYPIARQVIADVRAARPTATIVLGGAHGTALPERTLEENPGLDVVVIGEGERTLCELVRAVGAGGDRDAVAGIAWRGPDGLRRTPPRGFIDDLDSIPFPARDLVPLSLYNRQHASRGFSRKYMRIAELVTTRGCPHRCIFCASHICTGRKLRARSVANVLAEVDDCVARYGVTHFSIEDDAFTFHRDNALALCAGFAARGLTWNCNARVDNVDRELLQVAARSGCLKVSFGVESGSPRILAKTRKGITVDEVRAAVREARAAGIRFVECTFLLGAHPDETPEDIVATQALIRELHADLTSLCVTCPYPGTEYARILQDRGLETVRRYYGSPRYVVGQLRKLRSLKELFYLARLGFLFVRTVVLGAPGTRPPTPPRRPAGRSE
jgi:radical SAM superfamily enzyme YgiQ (UPF0313 family)